MTSTLLAYIALGFCLVGIAFAGFETFVQVRTGQPDEYGGARLSPRFVLRMRAAAVVLGIGLICAFGAYAWEHFF